MLERTVVVGSSSGLHARPAALFVQAAAAQPAAVRLRVGERSVDARSLLGVMSLKAKQGTEVTLEVEGEDAASVLESLAELLARDLDAEGEGGE